MCVLDGVKTFEFVRHTLDVKTALVPGIEDATCASLPNCVAQVASSPCWWAGRAVVGVGVGVGVGIGVGVVVGVG